MSVPAHEATRTFDCGVSGCDGEAKVARGLWGSLCDRHKAELRARGSLVVNGKTRKWTGPLVPTSLPEPKLKLLQGQLGGGVSAEVLPVPSDPPAVPPRKLTYSERVAVLATLAEKLDEAKAAAQAAHAEFTQALREAFGA